VRDLPPPEQPGARSAAPPAAPVAAAPAPGPPPVLIDRIEIVTPPAESRAVDPFASIAGRRRGRSRHVREGT
jgi:hypothetical protein